MFEYVKERKKQGGKRKRRCGQGGGGSGFMHMDPLWIYAIVCMKIYNVQISRPQLLKLDRQKSWTVKHIRQISSVGPQRGCHHKDRTGLWPRKGTVDSKNKVMEEENEKNVSLNSVRHCVIRYQLA